MNWSIPLRVLLAAKVVAATCGNSSVLEPCHPLFPVGEWPPAVDREQVLVQTSVHRLVERLSTAPEVMQGRLDADSDCELRVQVRRLTALLSRSVSALGEPHHGFKARGAFLVLLVAFMSLLGIAIASLRSNTKSSSDEAAGDGTALGPTTRSPICLPRGSLNRAISFVDGDQTPSNEASPNVSSELCADLVHITECCLFVPIRPLREGSFDITDSSGEALVHVAPRGPSACLSPHAQRALKSPAAASSGTDLWRLVLAAPANSGERSIFAQCYVVNSQGSMRFHIRHGGGSYFAELSLHDDPEMANRQDYVMVVAGEIRYHFVGDHRCGTMHIITDEDKECGEVRTICCNSSSNASASHYELRCAPLTDAVAMLCGLLCIEWHNACM